MYRAIQFYIFLAYFLSLFISRAPPAYAEAWVIEKGHLNIFSSFRKYNANTTTVNDIQIPYGGAEFDFFTEYGLTDKITFTNKLIFGHHGAGVKLVRPKVFVTETGLRFQANWMSPSLFPSSFYKMLRKNSPTIGRNKVSSIGLTMNYSRQNKNKVGISFNIAHGDVIYNISRYNLYIRTELENKLVYWSNNEGSYALKTSIALGYKKWEIGYERYDTLSWNYQHQKYTSFNAWIINIPLTDNYSTFIKWGKDKPPPHLPKEKTFTIGVIARI